MRGLNLHRLFITGVLLAAFALAGCGVKGPPIPPGTPPLPGTTELACRLADGSAILAWTLPEPLADSRTRDAHFSIYRSRTDLSVPACETCPLVYAKVAEVPFVYASDSRYTFTVPLDPGYRYTFKVKLEAGGQTGADSNPVHFDLPRQVTPTDRKAP